MPTRYIELNITMKTGLRVKDNRLCRKEEVLDTVHLKEGLCQFKQWLTNLSNPILIAHNGNRFDFPLLFNFVEKYADIRNYT